MEALISILMMFNILAGTALIVALMERRDRRWHARQQAREEARVRVDRNDPHGRHWRDPRD